MSSEQFDNTPKPSRSTRPSEPQNTHLDDAAVEVSISQINRLLQIPISDLYQVKTMIVTYCSDLQKAQSISPDTELRLSDFLKEAFHYLAFDQEDVPLFDKEQALSKVVVLTALLDVGIHFNGLDLQTEVLQLSKVLQREYDTIYSDDEGTPNGGKISNWRGAANYCYYLAMDYLMHFGRSLDVEDFFSNTLGEYYTEEQEEGDELEFQVPEIESWAQVQSGSEEYSQFPLNDVGIKQALVGLEANSSEKAKKFLELFFVDHLLLHDIELDPINSFAERDTLEIIADLLDVTCDIENLINTYVGLRDSYDADLLVASLHEHMHLLQTWTGSEHPFSERQLELLDFFHCGAVDKLENS